METNIKEVLESKKFTNKQLKDFICDIVKLVPSEKYARVNYIINKEDLSENLTFEKINEIIECLIEEAENERYYYSSYFDYGLDEEVVDGDESWIDRVDIALRGVSGLLNQEKYEEAMILYEKIFDIIEGGYEDFYRLLPGYYHIEENLESDIQDHYIHYLNTIYNSKGINKLNKFIIVFSNKKYIYSKNNLIHKYCKDNNDFVNNMIEPIVAELAKKCDRTINKIIFLLLMEKNGIEDVVEFLKENIKENIYVFYELCKYMEDKEMYQDLLNILYIIEKEKMDSNQKEKIFEKIIDVAGKIYEVSVKEKYLYKINEINPSLKYTLEICKKLPYDEKILAIKNLKEKFIKHEQRKDEEILIELINGNYEQAYENLKIMKKYEKQNIEDLLYYYIFEFGYKTIREKKLLEKQLEYKIKNIDNELCIEEIYLINNSIEKKYIVNENKLNIEKEFAKKFAKITKEVLNTQQRGRYDEIATYLMILVEHYYKEDRKDEAIELLKKYKNEYRRYTAYTKCIKEKIIQTGLNLNF